MARLAGLLRPPHRPVASGACQVTVRRDRDEPDGEGVPSREARPGERTDDLLEVLRQMQQPLCTESLYFIARTLDCTVGFWAPVALMTVSEHA
ncbi:MAG: hypothetical protein AB8H86_31890 [Polyangiales bacterium]